MEDVQPCEEVRKNKAGGAYIAFKLDGIENQLPVD